MPPGESNMADQKTPEEIKAEQDAADAAAKAAADTDKGGDDPNSLRRALAKQAAEKDAENAKLSKQLAAVESDKLKAKEQKMIEDGELKELIAAREKTIADLTVSAATSARSLLESSAREQLRNLGMSDPLYLTGALAGLPKDATAESITEWAKLIKADNATAFTAPFTPVGQASLPGGPATNAGGSNVNQLKADLQDPAKAASAAKELEARVLRGEAIN